MDLHIRDLRNHPAVIDAQTQLRERAINSMKGICASLISGMEIVQSRLDTLSSRIGRTSHRGPQLDNLTKNELYEKAQKMGIEGRSQMSKSELIDSIRDHR